MLAAFLEWVLWIGAFMYCLWKVFRKSEHWTVNLLAVIVAVAFLLLRYVPGLQYTAQVLPVTDRPLWTG